MFNNKLDAGVIDNDGIETIKSMLYTVCVEGKRSILKNFRESAKMLVLLSQCKICTILIQRYAHIFNQIVTQYFMAIRQTEEGPALN